MYAPAATVVLREVDDALVGYGAPAEGSAPCLLYLLTDETIIAFARATRYSPAAAAKSIRFGWCGVHLPGLAVAAAAGDVATVRCGVTKRVLWQRRQHAPAARRRPDRPLTVFDVLARSRGEDAAPSLAEIRPFIRGHIARHGAGSFINATFETFLGRSAERSMIDKLSEGGERELADRTLSAVLSSAEYLERTPTFIPGPFNAAFAYDLAILTGSR